MSKNLILRQVKKYGSIMNKPINDAAKTVSKLIGYDLLTPRDLSLLEKLGYTFEVQPLKPIEIKRQWEINVNLNKMQDKRGWKENLKLDKRQLKKYFTYNENIYAINGIVYKENNDESHEIIGKLTELTKEVKMFSSNNKRLVGLDVRKTPLEYTITKRLSGTGNELTMIIDRFKNTYTIVNLKCFEIKKSTMVRDSEQAKLIFRNWKKELERKPKLCYT